MGSRSRRSAISEGNSRDSREFRYSAELGFNLTSTLENPQVGQQVFTVSELTTNEPDPRFFQPPDGYKIVDKRKPADPPQ